LLNTVSNDAPRMDGNHIMILDPFVGSGTTLVEAALLGCPSTGIDIDPLSCLISESKIYLLNSDFRDIRSACHSIIDLHKEINPNRENGTPYKFPKVISKKFDKWGTIEEKEAYENEIDTWRATISTIKEKRIRDLFFVCLSDSLTRKFNIRMMGTGVGRFALEISSKGITSMMYQNIEHLMRSSFTCNQLRIAYSLRLPSAEVKQGDARKMDVKDESKSIILTSPPYLPASSGRENYLTGKSISITALGLLDEKELLQYDENSLGSMKANSSANKDGIPEAVYDLFEWLKKDESRALKAEPILAYYQDIKAALEETYRVLMPGGLAIYVIGKESVFYQFSTRKVLRRVMCDQIFIELAKNAGFEVVKQIDIELDKRNRNARPRSKDSYFESAIIIKKPR